MFIGGSSYTVPISLALSESLLDLGSNWVPADSFLTTITDRRYRAWLTLLRDGNQNMIRLWGGGVYEPDVFYDICDGTRPFLSHLFFPFISKKLELGILVWQDFQFSCGVYPAHDEFVASVRREAEDNVKRLRHHPSMTLFCGNNEDYQMVLQWGSCSFSSPLSAIYILGRHWRTSCTQALRRSIS